ncbi:hypothetical protein CO151_04505 [bacterium CG_4_9_14_3_um_filter_65_15]|nr:MAG: hypothetical protein CO151_04505 [bacterium CG_4_9_14_3_um_filter_65_15]
MAKSRDRDRTPTSAAGPSLPAWWISESGWTWWLRQTLLILVLLAVIYPGAMFQGEVFRSSDAGNSLAFASVGDRSLEQGHYPLWNPYLFAGMPSFGSLAYAKFLYPPSVLFDFLQTRLGFPPLTWLLGHLLFGGLGMAWLLRRWHPSQGAILLGVAIWLLFPKVAAWGVHGHGSKLGAAMYLPWLVGWSLRILDRGRWSSAGMLGLLLGLQLLRGHIQIAYYSLGVVAWLSFWGAVWPLEAAWRSLQPPVRWLRVGKLAVGLALGFLIAGILLVPVYQYSGLSIRGQDTAGGGGVGLDYATGWSLSPRELPTFVLPSAAGFGQTTYLGMMPFNDYPNYFGFLVLLLAALAWGPGRRRWLIVTLALSVLAVFTAFGNYGFGFYELLYRWLPFFNKFRVPSMILILVAFCLALAAPRGVEAWVAGESRWPRRLAPLICAGLGAVLSLAAVGLGHGVFVGSLEKLAAAAGKPTVPVLLDAAWTLHRSDLVRIGIVLLLAGGAFQVARLRPGFARSGLPWALCLLVVVDLMGVDARITHPERSLLRVGRGASGQAVLLPASPLVAKFQPARAEPGPHAALLQRALPHDRLYPLGQNGGRNTWMADGIRSLGGYHPAKPAAYESIRKRLYGARPAGRLALWLGAGVVSFDRAFTAQEQQLLAQEGLDLDPAPLATEGPVLYRLRSYLPRARLVNRWETGGATFDDFLDEVQAGRMDPGTTVHLPTAEMAELPAVMDVAPDSSASVEYLVDGLDEVILKTGSSQQAVLVLADMTTPGWRVEVDGRPRPMLTADFVLRGVYLEPGRHEVRFIFGDPAVKQGLILTCAGLIITLLLLLGGYLACRRGSGPGGAQA